MTRRKVLICIAVFIFVVTMICVMGLVYFNDQAVLQSSSFQHTKEDLAYYRRLGRECLKRSSVSCCMTSVRRMMTLHAREVPSEGCAEGFQPNIYRCLDSYRWCESKNFK